MTIEELISQQSLLEVVHPNMAELSQSDQTLFAMLRRSGLGASDSAIYLGVNPYQKVEDLIDEKKSIGLTAHELEVAAKENVRKGRDLEPLILAKFEQQMHTTIEKPSPMYRILAHPQLTINFDGVGCVGETLFPVEAKFASTYANKYWNRACAVEDLFSGEPRLCGGYNVIEHIQEEAKLYGIPPYYYTQIQQQMLGLGATFGYFAVLFDKGWEFKAFKIYKDHYVQNTLIEESERVWNKIKPRS